MSVVWRVAVWQAGGGVTDPARTAMIAAIEQMRPGTSAYWAERLAFAAVCLVKAELRFLDAYEATVPEHQAYGVPTCRS